MGKRQTREEDGGEQVPMEALAEEAGGVNFGSQDACWFL